MTDASEGLLRIHNRHAVKSLKDYRLMLSLMKDGIIFRTTELSGLDLAAGRDTLLNILPFLPRTFEAGSETHVIILFTLSADALWAPAGHIIASNQFALTGLPENRKKPIKYADVGIAETDTTWQIKGIGFQAAFSKKNGALVSWLSAGKEQVYASMLPHFTRPLTDNDRRGWKPHKKLKEWYDPQLVLAEMKVQKMKTGMAEIVSAYSIIDNKASVRIVYLVNGDGVIKVNYNLIVKDSLPNIPRVGMQCGIRREFENINWFGRGPLENYIDRRYGFDAGIYSQSLEDFMEPYVYPQENANRTDVRWMFLADKQNDGLLVVADSLLSMSAWPYTEAQIVEAKHTNALIDAGFITLNIDLIQMGVGGNDTWSDVSQPLEKYQIPAKDYEYCFYLVPLTVKKGEIGEKAKGIKFPYFH